MPGLNGGEAAAAVPPSNRLTQGRSIASVKEVKGRQYCAGRRGPSPNKRRENRGTEGKLGVSCGEGVSSVLNTCMLTKITLLIQCTYANKKPKKNILIFHCTSTKNASMYQF